MKGRLGGEWIGHFIKSIPLLVPRANLLDLPTGMHHRAQPRVGGADQGPPRFHGASCCHVKVLVGFKGVAEPGVVGGVDQYLSALERLSC